jgi:hypothetical protein
MEVKDQLCWVAEEEEILAGKGRSEKSSARPLKKIARLYTTFS